MEILIREAKISDAKNIIDYVNGVGGESDFLTFGRDEFPRGVEEQARMITSVELASNSIILIATANDEIIALGSITGGARTRIKHIGELGITVSKKFWGRGVGRKMIEELIAWSISNEYIEKINLKVREDNYRGVKLYSSLGFVEEGTLTKDFKVNFKYYNSKLMGLEL